MLSLRVSGYYNISEPSASMLSEPQVGECCVDVPVATSLHSSTYLGCGFQSHLHHLQAEVSLIKGETTLIFGYKDK